MTTMVAHRILRTSSYFTIALAGVIAASVSQPAHALPGAVRDNWGW